MRRRVNSVGGTYGVVRFTVSRAADGGEGVVPATKFVDSLWTGTDAANAVEAKHATAIVDSMERTCIIINNIPASLCEHGGIQSEKASVDCNTVVTYVLEQYLKTKQRVTLKAKTVEEGKTAGG